KSIRAKNLFLKEDESIDLSSGQHIGLKSVGSTRLLNLPLIDMEWILAQDDDSDIFHTDGISRVAMRLGELEKKLPIQKFIRVHRSYIVACNRIKEITKDRTLKLRNVVNKKEIPIGRTYHKEV